jgi:hypothetical protein
MGTLVIIMSAIGLVIVAVQFSCLFQYEAPKQQPQAPADACPEV